MSPPNDGGWNHRNRPWTCVTRAMLITHVQEATKRMVEHIEVEDKHQREERAKWQASFSQKTD